MKYLRDNGLTIVLLARRSCLALPRVCYRMPQKSWVGNVEQVQPSFR